MQTSHSQDNTVRYIPLLSSAGFLLRRKRLIGWSSLLFIVTIFFTWAGYQISLGFIDELTGSFFQNPPESGTIWGWIKHKGWLLSKWLYLFITRIAAFYLAFLLAYTLTTPGYSLLSTSTEKIQAGSQFEDDDGFTLRGIAIDLFEGMKIGLFGILVTIAALMANFIPLLGQLFGFLLITYYSALMFLDYPASRRRWSLGQKLRWLKAHGAHSFRLGLLPAVISMVPLLNVFFISLLFPLLTVHATLNFVNHESSKTLQPSGNTNGR